MYFTDGNLRLIEREIVAKPNFPKPRSGIKIMSYSPIKTRTTSSDFYLNFEDGMNSLLSEINYPQLIHRVKHSKIYKGERASLFQDSRHRSIFNHFIQEGELPEMRSSPSFVSALFLLTVDPFIWYRINRRVKEGAISFYSTLREAGPRNQILYQTAKDLYCGVLQLSLDDLCRPEMIDDHLFSLLMTAFLLRRYGISVLIF